MKKRCWNRNCRCTHFTAENIRKDGFLCLCRFTCPDCGTVWWEGVRDDDVQVASATEPETKTENVEVTP